MNQRFQNADIRLVSEQYAGNELYKAVCTIGSQLETELSEFGLCPEECFMETLEVLSVIADKGEAVMSELDTIWHRKNNEYKRFDRSVNEDEIRKVVGIIFGFVMLATDSSRHPFYRRTLTEEIVTIIANHKFCGWAETISRICDVPLADGWFDAYIDEEPKDEERVVEFVKDVETLRKQMPGSNITVQFVDKQYNTSCQQFMGKMENPKFIVTKQNEAI